MASIGIMTHDFSGRGIDTVIEYQARALMEDGHQVTIIALTGDLRPSDGIRLCLLHRPLGFIGDRIVFLTLPFNYPVTINKLSELSKFDVLIAHFYPMTWLADFTKKLCHTKYVLYNHGFLDTSGVDMRWLESAYLKATTLLYGATIGKPDEAVSVSRYSRSQLGQLAGLDSRIIYNPVDSELFHAGLDSSRIRNEYGLGTSPVITYIGAIEPIKGIDLLINVHRLVRKTFPDARLLILGKAKYKEYLNQIRGSIDDSMKLVGWVPAEEVPRYLAATDVCVSASFTETFNLPLAEAQACGKPVVAFNVGGHREIVEDGQTGFLVRPGDVDAFASKVITLLSNEDRRYEMGARGRLAVQQKFNFQRFSSETKSLIQGIL